jgi:hypothetical protein
MMRNFDDFLNEIFNELKIETKLRKILKKVNFNIWNTEI